MGYGKNNRRRGHVKVRRTRKPDLKFRSRKFSSKEVQAKWENNLTLNENYLNLGLSLDPNDFKKQQMNPKLENDVEPTLEVVKFYDVPDSDLLSTKNNRKPDNYMTEEEIIYLRSLIKVHKDNYAAMQRDTKTNSLQWTETKLQRRCARLKLLDANMI